MNDEKTRGREGHGITEQEARTLVYQFLKREGDPNTRDYIESHLEMTGVREHPNLGEIFTFEGEPGEFWVSRGRGTVVKYNAPPAFTITEAEDFSRKFIPRHIPDFGSRNFKLESSGADGQFWREEWREYPQGENEVAIFPNWISVTVSLERRAIHNFNYSDLRRIRYKQPGIDEGKARRIIMERFPEGEIVEIELVEHTADGGRTWVTIWNAVVRPGEEEDLPHEIISIDADTGKDVPL
ncbi:MAG: hypothetical protein R6U43_11555 [Candidatus Krumholzibacteriales bacterium]